MIQFMTQMNGVPSVDTIGNEWFSAMVYFMSILLLPPIMMINRSPECINCHINAVVGEKYQ